MYGEDIMGIIEWLFDIKKSKDIYTKSGELTVYGYYTIYLDDLIKRGQKDFAKRIRQIRRDYGCYPIGYHALWDEYYKPIDLPVAPKGAKDLRAIENEIIRSFRRFRTEEDKTLYQRIYKEFDRVLFHEVEYSQICALKKFAEDEEVLNEFFREQEENEI